MGVKEKNIIIQPPNKNCGLFCEKILRALPDWFGIEESIVQYIKDADEMPTMLAKDDDVVVGFLTIKTHFSKTAEIHCMGILPQYHGKGIGKILIKKLENYLKDSGVKMLQVKTISEDSDCKFYTKTREFYKSVGFIPLEVFPKLWDEANPCLQLVKII
jgi:N-acetylglutamate synthase-like GNAT family acetyltransferase